MNLPSSHKGGLLNLIVRSFFVLLFLTKTALAVPAAVTDPNFLILNDGTDLKQMKASGINLTLASGTGTEFTAAQQTAYQRIKNSSQMQLPYKVQWSLMNLDSRQVLAQSKGADIKMYGASVAKVYTAAALLQKQNGSFSQAQLQLLADLIVVSSNSAWGNLQDQIGDGNSDRGRQITHEFTQKMGYVKTRGFHGFWGEMHGNELTAAELAQTLCDIYHQKFAGSDVVWKLMHTSRLGAARAQKYLPKSLIVGGKTGSYDGPTVNPETGLSTNPDGSPFTVKTRNHIIVFNYGEIQYGLAILTDTGDDETAAVLAGGLFREFIAEKVQ